MAATRIYRVTDGDLVRLIEATSASAAIRHCASSRYGVSAAKTRDVAYLMATGIKVEQATVATAAE